MQTCSVTPSQCPLWHCFAVTVVDAEFKSLTLSATLHTSKPSSFRCAFSQTYLWLCPKCRKFPIYDKNDTYGIVSTWRQKWRQAAATFKCEELSFKEEETFPTPRSFSLFLTGNFPSVVLSVCVSLRNHFTSLSSYHALWDVYVGVTVFLGIVTINSQQATSPLICLMFLTLLFLPPSHLWVCKCVCVCDLPVLSQCQLTIDL